MGLGKTIQVVAALRRLLAARAMASALIVAPAGLVLNWRRELKAWAPDLRLSTVLGTSSERGEAWRRDADVYLVGYESLRSDIGHPVVKRLWDLVVLDEAQRIKNPLADVTIAVKRLRRTRAWVLTGTPLENSLSDLASILDFVAPGAYDPNTYLVGLRRVLARFQLRRRRADVLRDLPPKMSSELVLDLAHGQRAAYETAQREGIVRLKSLGRDLRVSHVLELILRLKQICNFCPETDASAKLSDLRSRLARIAAMGERALVFSQFAQEPFGVHRLARELRTFEPYILTGEMDQDTRAAAVRAFQSGLDSRPMILSLKAGGVGLTLTAASYVFHFDRWWNPATEAQAEDRAYRIGQTRPVHVYAYLTAGTVEERIAQILSDKRALFSDVIDDMQAPPLERLDLRTLLEIIDPAIGHLAG
ncbi:MAG: DEAD/DEAH box helicase [Alphaproteobacteria bacterium]|nr:DEAD/DEAH box helicase [Alphaproteobacteria bacterium]